MKAFLMSLLLLIAISLGAAVTLSLVPSSAQDSYTQKDNVRL